MCNKLEHRATKLTTQTKGQQKLKTKQHETLENICKEQQQKQQQQTHVAANGS